MGIQINGQTDIISASDGSLEVDGFVFKNKTAAERNAGVSTATGAVIFNTDTNFVEAWDGSRWTTLTNTNFNATGGTVDSSGRTGFKVHTFTEP